MKENNTTDYFDGVNGRLYGVTYQYKETSDGKLALTLLYDNKEELMTNCGKWDQFRLHQLANFVVRRHLYENHYEEMLKAWANEHCNLGG